RRVLDHAARVRPDRQRRAGERQRVREDLSRHDRRGGGPAVADVLRHGVLRRRQRAGPARPVHPGPPAARRGYRTQHHLAPRPHRHRLGVRLRPHQRLGAAGPRLEVALQARQLLLSSSPPARAAGSPLRQLLFGRCVMRRAVTLWAWVGLFAAAAVPGGAPARSSQPSLKIGFISSRQILQQTPGYAAAESTFNKEVQGYRDEVQKLQQQLDSAVQAFDQQSIALSPTAKQAKQKELQALQQRVEQRSNELQDRAAQRERELLAPIQQRVNSVVQAARGEGQYPRLVA